MNWKEVSNSDLQDWQQNPVTEAMQGALRLLLEKQRRAAEAAYWADKPWPEHHRKALTLLEVWQENFFEATKEDLEAALGEEE